MYRTFYMTRRQAAEWDPTWDYENPEGTLGMTEGWYWLAPEGYYPDEQPHGPYKSEAETRRFVRMVFEVNAP